MPSSCAAKPIFVQDRKGGPVCARAACLGRLLACLLILVLLSHFQVFGGAFGVKSALAGRCLVRVIANAVPSFMWLSENILIKHLP